MIKAKPLFLYLAERANLRVVNDLDLSKIDLGKDKRAITATGKLTQKYDLLLPKELISGLYYLVVQPSLSLSLSRCMHATMLAGMIQGGPTRIEP